MKHQVWGKDVLYHFTKAYEKQEPSERPLKNNEMQNNFTEHIPNRRHTLVQIHSI